MTTAPRFGTPEDVDGLWDVFKLGFGAPEDRRDEWISGIDPARALIIDGPRGEIAAASHIRRFDQWFGGRAVPLGGFSPVAVQPEFRGRGFGREVTAGQFAELRDRGEVISGLYPASLALYRSVGFECAGSYVLRRFPSNEIGRLVPSRRVEVRRGVAADVAAVHRLHEASGQGRDGTLRRDKIWWARRLPEDLRDVILYVVDAPGSSGAGGDIIGYAIYRHGSASGPYDYSVVASEVLSDDPDVVRALWHVVGSSGSQAPVTELIGPADDDLFLMLDNADPVAVRTEIRWMLRIIDAPGAIAARGWPGGARGQVHLSIRDHTAPWNTGRWMLDVAGGAASLTPGGRGTVEATIGGLSCWWSGYAPASRLVRTGQMRSSDRAQVDLMDQLLPAVPPVLLDFY